MKTCDFCEEECDGKLILKDIKKDGSDLIVCSTCLNLYIDGEFLNLYIDGEYDKLLAGIGGENK